MALVRPSSSDEAARILSLARRDRDAASEVLATRSLEEQVALVCETPVGSRSLLLDLLPAPEKVIPRIPEAELCFTVKAVGPSQAGWIVEHATPEQLVACVDLDGWTLQRFDPERLRDWLRAAADAGPETLVSWHRAMDPEVLVLELHDRVEVTLPPSDATDRESWNPPPGSLTLDGQFHYAPRRSDDDVAEITALLRALFEASYWDYYRLMQGAIHELPSETEEWAARWRRGRLEDLGFPPREESAALFARLDADERTVLPEAETEAVLDVEGWALPVWFPKVPLAADAPHLVLSAAAKLPEAERQAFLYRLLAVANKVAVAYDLPLSDVESVPTALDEAVRMTSRGLEELATAHGEAPEALLRRVPLERLFQVGASFHPEKAELVLSKLPPEDDDEPEMVSLDDVEV